MAKAIGLSRFYFLGDRTRVSGNYEQDRNRKVLRAVLENMFAEACLPGYESKETEMDCFYRAIDLGELAEEIIRIYAVAKAWKNAGEGRAYRACVYVGSDGIRKSKHKEWQRVKAEAAPQPHKSMFKYQSGSLNSENLVVI